VLSFIVLAALAAEPGQVLDLSIADAATLTQHVWASSPDLQAARVRVAAARADAERALMLPNPGLDLSVNTLPIGPLNPVDLKDPLLNVPNVAVGLSVLLEVGKRELRQESTREAARAAALDALEQLRQRVLTVEETISDLAAAEVRVSTLEELARDADKLTKLQRARADKGDTAPLDADRAQLEAESTLTLLGDARDAVAEALRSCAELVGVPCLPFNDRAKATTWLERGFDATHYELAERPDVASLAAATRSAQAAELLASRRWAPDPTLRVGYVHDRFVISGNQQNSLFVGLSLPLPLFDHGQADERAAHVAALSTNQARERLLATAQAQLDRVEGAQKNVDARLKRLREQTLPLAVSVVERLDAAITRGAAPIQELLLARRSFAELLLTTNDLDRASFRLRVARARITGAGLVLPTELVDAK
jgi:cobalt-zinc-cadmium efflux system outer membrane protein